MSFGRDICGVFTEASSREWLVTNGLGGYACGTIAGANTRRYHGFLMASLKPPVERKLLVAKIDTRIDYRGLRFDLSANEFADGTIDPQGFVHLESFDVDDGLPVWRYALADALVEQRIFMAPGANTTYLRLEVLRAGAPMKLEFKPLVTARDDHAHARGLQRVETVSCADGCTVIAAGVPPYHLRLPSGHYAADDMWYWNFWHREEAARGLDALEDLYGPGRLTADLSVGEPVYLTATAEEAEPRAGSEVLEERKTRAARLKAALPARAPVWIQALAVATDQFIVQRGPKSAGRVSVIAGYPWFTDWGRDTMIALPGLTTVLRRFDITAAILRTFAALVDRGMLPNRFADTGESLEYNTADATLWLFQALREHLDATPDPTLLRDLYPTLKSIIQAHVEGTRHGIGLDPADGLLRAGEPGSQVTWMDAKQGDHAFTPRVGKPVEINALWLNALAVTARLAGRLRDPAMRTYCEALGQRAGAGFARFWNPGRGCLYDVIDVDGGTGVDASVRPNQLFAVSLPHCALPLEQMRAVVATCAHELLTSHGLRSLSPADSRYTGRYLGGVWQRDASYHQGTVWAWLLGPFARAHYRVYGNAARALEFLAPLEQHMNAACRGTIGEIFDGDAPHAARGCFAQAWSVAETLRAWIDLKGQDS